jgi:hypothetical protein
MMAFSMYLILIRICRYLVYGRLDDPAAIWKEVFPDDKLGRPNPSGREGLHSSDQYHRWP